MGVMMNTKTEVKTKRGLDLMREPFEPNQISKLPKGTKAQNECEAKEKINCTVCGGWHHPKIIHLDYVGHAALTDRLLECDPNWEWQPLAFDDKGFPALDDNGGMWIKLTVCGVTRLGYGDAPKKSGGDAVKERIGDALRNAAMRFGAALDLWHKGDLHGEEPDYPITLEQSTLIVESLNLHEVKAEVFCAKANIRSISDLPTSKFDEAFTWIEKRGEYQRNKNTTITEPKKDGSLLKD
jgi:hypothetical protein